MSSFSRPVLSTLIQRMAEPRRFLQVLAGPRQAGKTTLARQLMKAYGDRSSYSTADTLAPENSIWIEQQWEAARFRCQQTGSWLLVLDEIQKISGWSGVIKRMWDEDSAQNLDLRVVLLGSSPLLVQRGLTESLAGRFEMLRIGHWSFSEMHAAFGWTIEQYLFFGGYPGAASLVEDEDRWRRYLLDSLIETTISRDILLMTRVDKPALLRQLFRLGCEYSSQILSYQKVLGQLQEAGNTTTLAHYLDLLTGAGMLCGLSKFSGKVVRQRGSSPKFQVLNNGLMTAQSADSFLQAQENPERWGRIAESAIGAHLANGALTGDYRLFYWREASKEVDYVLQKGNRILAIEVKSGHRPAALPGMAAFDKIYAPAKKFRIGTSGMSFEEFLSVRVAEFF